MKNSNSSGKRCPKCHLINPSTAKICDCGYNFETGMKGPGFEVKTTGEKSSLKWVVRVIVLVIGVVVTLLGLLLIVAQLDSYVTGSTVLAIIIMVSGAALFLGALLSGGQLTKISRVLSIALAVIGVIVIVWGWFVASSVMGAFSLFSGEEVGIAISVTGAALLLGALLIHPRIAGSIWKDRK